MPSPRSLLIPALLLASASLAAQDADSSAVTGRVIRVPAIYPDWVVLIDRIAMADSATRLALRDSARVALGRARRECPMPVVRPPMFAIPMPRVARPFVPFMPTLSPACTNPLASR